MRISARNLIILVLFVSGLGYYVFRELVGDQEPVPASPVVHQLLGAEETCVQCHGRPTGMVASHDPQLIGCSPCHKGQATESDKEAAHEGLLRVPGNLADVSQTCGAANCHQTIAHRVEHSLMATMSGIVGVDRYAFGELEVPEGHYHIEELGYSAADTHLRQLCASCHLGNAKTVPGPITELSRGGGCNACHLNYSAAAEAALQSYQVAPAAGLAVHPTLSLAVSDAHCFGCHSRSSRISLNYTGWHETTLAPAAVEATDPRYRVLEDGRVVEYIHEDVHHQAGLACIDCHHVDEVMGDGNTYAHKAEALRVGCEDCHRAGAYPTRSYAELDTESKRLLALRGWTGEDKRFVVTATDLNLLNVWLDTLGQARLKGKNDNRLHHLPAPADICTREGGHARLSCASCHTNWAPQCIGCHNTFEPASPGFDWLEQREVSGSWVEHVGTFFHGAPSLGIVEKRLADSRWVEEVRTFIPGMSLTIDTDSFHQADRPELFHRLFAPTAAHTVQAVGRSCASCHSNPVALGYGRGQLQYELTGSRGRWIFRPDYGAEPADGLPQDAWIGFLEEPASSATVRQTTRPFNLAEQQRILQVGACLTCHQEKDPILIEGITNFDEVLRKRSSACVLPVWE